MQDFKAIPQTGGKYEINSAGQIRNTKTGRILKPRPSGWNRLSIAGAQICVHIPTLLLQIHGIPLQRKKPRTAIPITIKRGSEVYHFDSLNKCCKFLSPIIFYSEGTIGEWLNRRKTYISGWIIEYEG